MSAAAARVEMTLEGELALARTEILSGDAGAAHARLTRLIAADSYTPILHYWLSAALGALGDKAGQRAALRTAQTYHGLHVLKEGGGDLPRFQQDPAYANEIADLYYRNKLVACAALAYGRAAAEPGATASLMLSYGFSLQHQGLIEDAIEIFEAAARAYPNPAIHEVLLVACMYSEGGVARHAREARRWAAQYGLTQGAAGRAHANPPLAGRRLRIGYFAPSFAGAQLRQFVVPVLEAHDLTAVEVYLYTADAADAGLPATMVRSVAGLNDAAVADQIRADRIDVLVDLWGHNVGGKVAMMASKLAPVQVSWMNYVQTTGIEAMDYALLCDQMIVPGTDELFTETVWPIGLVMSPFRPGERPEPTPTPALRNGYVTFGCFNNPCKLSDVTVAGWARVLKANPTSRLVLKYGYYADPILQNATSVRFAAHGVDPDRLEFRGHSKGADYFREYGDIDLALDPSPCPGGTTSWDTVSCGVPLLTLQGEDFYARCGLVTAFGIGLPELAAADWDDYVALSRTLTQDFEALDALRKRVRLAFDTSAARDEVGFTRRLEGVFAEMFERWSS